MLVSFQLPVKVEKDEDGKWQVKDAQAALMPQLYELRNKYSKCIDPRTG